MKYRLAIDFPDAASLDAFVGSLHAFGLVANRAGAMRMDSLHEQGQMEKFILRKRTAEGAFLRVREETQTIVEVTK